MAKFGIEAPTRGEISVFLWDADLNLPHHLEKAGGSIQARDSASHGMRLSTPLARVFADGSMPAVLLPSSDRTRDRAGTADWLESSAVHEGFHALLREWMGIGRVRALFSSLAWQKMEELCAVWIETRVFPENRSHLDYGRAWLATLMLTHADQVTAPTPAS